MVPNRSLRPRFRPVALFALALAALVGGTIAHVPREAQAQRSSTASGFLGVSLQDLTPSLRDSYDYQGNGVLVSDVVAGSPAAKLGIREGDILLRIEDDAVSTAEQVTEKVRALRPGSLVGITVVRDGDTKYLGRAEIADLSTVRDDDDERWTPAAPRAPRAPRVAPAPSSEVRTIVMNGRGRLGVETHDLDADLAKYFKARADAGVLVLRVVEDTPAAKAGLKAGDVITSVGGTAVADGEALRGALRDRDAGDIELRILREGAARTVTARLEEAPRWNMEHRGSGPGWMSWMHGPDDLKGMDPKGRREFEQEMRRLGEEMRDLIREMRDLRDDERDDARDDERKSRDDD
jgi:membrane-associated protease RseP (regulator of RpoE activity)